jgi:hypothetical protein
VLQVSLQGVGQVVCVVVVVVIAVVVEMNVLIKTGQVDIVPVNVDPFRVQKRLRRPGQLHWRKC